MKAIGAQIFLAVLLLAGWGLSAQPCKPQVNWSDTIAFCQGNALTLSAYNPNCNYLWNTGASTASITITTSGTYWVSVTNNCGNTRDTVYVHVQQPLFPNLGNDRVLCSGSNPILSVASLIETSYLWQDGSTNNTCPVTASGQYHVAVTNSCGTFRDTVNISYLPTPAVDLGPDVNYCSPFAKTLSVNPALAGNVSWSNGSNATAITVSSPGIYWVQASNNCGSDRDTVQISYQQGNLLDIGDTAYKCINGFATLHSNISGGSYQWSTGASTASISVGQTGTYWLKYTDSCGVYYDSVEVVVAPAAVADLGPDRQICNNRGLILQAGNPGSSYQWSNGSSGPFITVSDSGFVWLGVNNGCGWDYDTIEISLKPFPDPDIDDTVYYCLGQSVQVDAGDWGPQSSYLWSNGSTSRRRNFSSDGSHWVRVANDCDTVVKNFYTKGVANNYSLDLGNDTVVCATELQLKAGLPANVFDFLWSNGSDKNNIKVTASGSYWLEASGPCGTLYDTIEIIIQRAPGIIPNPNLSLCQGDSLIISAPYVDFTHYLWSTGDTTHEITVKQSGFYYLMSYNTCDTLFDTVQVTMANAINVDLGPDTSFCEPYIYYLDMSNKGADSTRWSTGSRNGGLPVSKSGTYWVTLYNACGAFSDTVNITVNPLPKPKLKSKVICAGSSVTLDAGQPNVQSYQWNTGATGASIVASQDGWYVVSMSNGCGTVKDSCYLRVDQPLQPINLGNDTIFCQGTLLLDPGYVAHANYRWQNGSTSQKLLVTKSGGYKVTVSNVCNTVSDSIYILITGPPKLVLGTTIKFCGGSTLYLNAQNPGSSYLWNTGDTTQSIPISTSGRYWVTMENPCGRLTDTVDVEVDFPLLNLDLGPDTLICQGIFLTLETQYSGVDYLWNTGAKTEKITVDTTGLYWVRVKNTCGEWYDSIFVKVQGMPVFDLGGTGYLCNIDGKLTIEGPPGMKSYHWSTGQQGRKITVEDPGDFWLVVSNECFQFADTLTVIGEDPIALDLGADTVVCNGKPLLLNPGNYSYPMRWQDGKIAPQREVSQSGLYWVAASNSCGSDFDTIEVVFTDPIPEGIFDTLACKGEETYFDFHGPGVSVLWFDGNTAPARSFKEEGIYSLSISNPCGVFNRQIFLTQGNCECPVHIPNAFTPDGDGLNDKFRIGYDCRFASYSIQIFDRWGKLLYEGSDYDDGWDGMIGKRPAAVGVYNYRVQYQWLVKGVPRENEQRGTVTLVR